MDAGRPRRYAEANRGITMKSLGCALILLLTPIAAHAEDTIASDRIIDAAIGDWNKDGKPDLALLVTMPPHDQADYEIGIYIYLRDKEHELLKLAADGPDKIWGRAEPDGNNPDLRGNVHRFRHQQPCCTWRQGTAVGSCARSRGCHYPE